MPESFTESDTSSPVQRCPAKHPTGWLEIEMIGEDGLPIPFVQYQVVLPDGKTVEGYLDREGFARLEQLPESGECRITFPEFDEEAWSYIDSTGPRPPK
jgi:hypothetical protein